MKYVFLTVWALVFVPLGWFTSVAMWKNPGSYQAYLFLAGFAYVGFCSFRLIQEGYRPKGLFESGNAGLWVCLLLLPLCMLPLHGAYETWQRDVYVPSSSGRRTYLSSLLLEGLQTLVRHWGPIIVMLVVCLATLVFLLGVIRHYRR